METRLHSHTQTLASVHSVRSLERRFAIDGWMDGLSVCFQGEATLVRRSSASLAWKQRLMLLLLLRCNDDRTSGACGFAFTSRSSLALSRLARVAGRLAGNCCGESVFASRDAR